MTPSDFELELFYIFHVVNVFDHFDPKTFIKIENAKTNNMKTNNI